eukprot:Nk52_evm1s830 gene=Nk52_evmTU1s830
MGFAGMTRASFRADKQMIITSLLASVGGLLFGYDVGIISGAMLEIKDYFDLGTFEQEVVVSVMLGGMVAGAASGGFLNDHFGRKTSIIFTCIVFVISSILMCAANSFAQLVVGRFLIGIAVAVSAISDILYVSELAPREKRGTLTSINELAITIGIMVSYLSNVVFTHVNSTEGWRYMFIVPVVPALIQGTAMVFLPASPRWLMLKERRDEAYNVLIKIRRDKEKEDVELELEEIRKELLEQKRGLRRRRSLNQLEGITSQQSSSSLNELSVNESSEDLIERNQESGGFQMELTEKGKIRKSSLRKGASKAAQPLLLVGIVTLLQQLSGQPTLLYYVATVLKDTGMSDGEALLASFFIGFAKFLATAVAVFLCDKCGRRTLLLLGSFLMACSLFVFAFVSNDPYGATTATIFFVCGYGLGFGPNVWLLQIEAFPNTFRAHAVSILNVVNASANLAISLCFLSILDAIGSLANFLMYSGICFIGTLYIYLIIPETKGKSLEISNMLYQLPIKELIELNISAKH